MTNNITLDLDGVRYAGIVFDFSCADPDFYQQDGGPYGGGNYAGEPECYNADPASRVFIGTDLNDVKAKVEDEHERCNTLSRDAKHYAGRLAGTDSYIYAFHRSMTDEDIKAQLWTTFFTAEDDRVEPQPLFKHRSLPTLWRTDDAEPEEVEFHPNPGAFAAYVPWLADDPRFADMPDSGADFECGHNRQVQQVENLD